MISNPIRLIICGTDTDVGKTVVSSWIVQGLNGIYWKPIQSGLENGGDTNQVCKLIDLPKERYLKEAYKFKAPVSPHWAAEKENKLIDPKKLEPPIVQKPLIIETAGGLLVPLTRQFLQINQLKNWGIPIILVARTGLGTLNHTLLSIEAIRNRKIPLLGVILNGDHHPDNPKTIEQIGKVKIIAQLPRLKKLNASSLAEQWQQQHLGNIFGRLLQI